jgi:DNA-binding transcriptional LysR family regulator
MPMIAPKQGTERIGRRLKLRDLRILMTVVECGTMGKAAECLAISQPVVSKAIADMEHALGVRLLDRSQRGVEPTPYGRALIKRGIAIFDEMRQGLDEIESLSDPTAGEVRIGATDPINAAIVAPVIDRLSRQYPRMTFYVVAGVPGPLRQEVAARNVDFAISRFARPASEEYSEEILFHDALVVATGPNNPLTRRRRKIELADLLNEPWVLDSPNTDFGAMQAGLFRAAGLDPPRLTVEATSIILRNELLATERFLTVVVSFSLLLPRKHPVLKALPVKLPDIRQPVGITTLKNRSLSPVAQMFIESVRELVKPLANRR